MHTLENRREKMGSNTTSVIRYFILLTWIIYLTRADIFTSIEKMKGIFFHEKRLLSGIKLALKNVDVTPETQDILRFCQERQEHAKLENFKESAINIKHPNGVYKMIRHFAATYKEVRLAIEKMTIPYLEMVLHDIPSGRDLHGAIMSLLRLQEVYGLDPADMTNGNYRGHQGPPLDVLETFAIGLVAFEEQKYPFSLQWFDITLAKLTANDTIKDPPMEQVVSLIHQSRAMVEKRHVNGGTSGLKHAKLPLLLRALNTNCSQEFFNDVVNAEMEKMHSLCAKMDQKYLKTGPSHTCIYKTMLLPYYRLGEEILSSSPYVSLIYNITSSKESNAIQKLASRQLYRAEVQEVQGSNRSDYRTSHVAFLGEADSKHLSSLTRRINRLTDLECLSNPNGYRLQQSAGEKYQVVNYGIGGHYSIHLDTYEESYPGSQDILKNSGNRIATVLIYLSKVESGGSTVFPWLNIAVPPLQLFINPLPQDWKSLASTSSQI